MSSPLDRRLFSLKWRSALKTNTDRQELPVAFVAEQGRSLRLIDVRERDELTDAVGHIPGSTWVPMAKVAEVRARLRSETPIVIVSRSGTRASAATRYLQALGMKYVAALSGGLLAWRATGYSTSRSTAVFERPLEAIPLTGGEPAGPLSAERIERHVGDFSQVRWVSLAALLLNGKRSCVDGRDEQGVVGTPGGDAGEFVLALGCMEDLTGKKLSDEAVQALLVSELDTFGRFYMHTDTQAWGAFSEAIRGDPRLASFLPTGQPDESWLAMLTRPPTAARPALLDHLENPDHLGCGHLRLMLTRPDEYGVRPGLVRSFLRAFHQLRWQGASELEFVTLSGEHNESGVLSVFVDGDLWDFSPIPLVSPSVGETQVFVAHPQVSHAHREHYVEFFRRARPAPLEAKHLAPFRAELHARAGRHLTATLGHLAKGLPLFEVHFNGDAKVRVSGGAVLV